ncbi:MAG: hypothetical protein QHH15_05940 [Candidatus Thermoplasmatota archaeon]|jgi:hypothetical protein|nr:hypothetical protein [Candidatus Thermoplasmatota archaeon]
MNIKLKKIDAIIIIAMIVIAGTIFFQFNVLPEKEKTRIPSIQFSQDTEKRTLTVKSFSDTLLWNDFEIIGKCDTSDLGEYVTKGDKINYCSGILQVIHKSTKVEIGNWTFPPEPELPYSILLPNEKDVSPQDEGVHFKSIINTREWWYFTAVFSNDCELPGWVVTIAFCHLAWGDLKLTLKPDVMVITLQSPNGEKYGGMINKKRGGILGAIGLLTLDAKTPGVDLKYGKSWAKGVYPDWHVHAEDEDIDEKNEIVIDLDFFATSSPLWIHSGRLIDMGEGKIANYVFTGCKVEGKVKINNLEFKVKGTGHHEHSWSPGFLQFSIKGWDWCYFVLDNGWTIYYTNYYLTRQIISAETTKINPLTVVIIITNDGKKITKLENVDVTVEKPDKLFVLLKIPVDLGINAKPKALSQPLLKSYNIKLELDSSAKNTYEKIWKFPTYVGMKIGLYTVKGIITWTDGIEQKVNLKGTGSVWFMRSF